MKKLTKIFALFLTLLTLLFSENIYAQNNYNKTDKQGRRQGKWIEYHSNGQIRYKGQFKNNEPVGEFLYYSENGNLFAKNKILKNNVTESEIYSPEGKVVAKGKYINKKKQDRWEYYSEEDGSLILVENYNNGNLVGKSEAYLAGTQLVIEETEYVNGMKHGFYSRFYDNGVPMIEAYYHNDKLSGNYIHYYQNGIVKEEGLFKDGAKVGEWKYYDISGNLISTDNYMESPIDGYMEIIEDE